VNKQHQEIKAGDRVFYGDQEFDGGMVRVMSIAEGWAMVRRKGCMPFCIMVKDLMERAARHERESPTELAVAERLKSFGETLTEQRGLGAFKKYQRCKACGVMHSHEFVASVYKQSSVFHCGCGKTVRITFLRGEGNGK